MDVLLPEPAHLGFQIATHKIKFVPIVLVGGMHCHFGGRQREDQPSVASVNGWESKDVPQEVAIGLRVFAVNNYVRA